MVKPDDNGSERLGDSSYSNTRRNFVAGSAGTLGALAAGGTVAGSVFAQEDDEAEEEEEGEEEEAEEEEMVESEFEDDVDILNFALTLEYLEARFYEQGLDNIGEEALCNCRALEEGSYLQEVAFDELRTIQEHEESHVETLVETIESLGGEPIEEPEFDFGMAVEYPMAFLGTAAQLEDIGVSAYAGAAPFIENEDLVPPALGIHSVEARHASFLQTLTGESGFPDVIDEARSRSTVLELAGGFIVGEDEEMPDENGDGPDDEGDEAPDDENGNGPDDEEAPDDENGDDPDDEEAPDDENGDAPDNGNGNETDNS